MTEKITYLNGFITKDNTTDGMLHRQGLLFNNKFDEPTYLSIRIDFFPDVIDKTNIRFTEFNKPLENMLNTLSYNTMPCPLLDDTSDYSTYKYLLENIGDEFRAHLLKKLIHGLADLSAYCPYYITSVDGINNLLTVDPKRGTRVKSDAILTLKCMEGLDQRISAIKNMYKKIAWDDVYQRWILPDMMRFFKMNIYISEFRVFHTANKTKSDKGINIINSAKDKVNSLIDNNSDNNQYDFKKYTDYVFLNMRMPTTVLTCEMCEFDISDSFSHLSSLSSAPKNNNLNDLEIKIKVGNIKEHSIYGLFGAEKDNSEESSHDNIISLNDVKFSKNFKDIKNDVIRNYHHNKEDLINEANINYYLRVNKLINDTEKENKSTFTQINNSLKEINLKISGESYFSKLIKNTTKNAFNWIKNEIKDEVVKFINDKMINGSSLNDIRRALKSENIFTMYNIFKTNAMAIKDMYPEVSSATNGNLDVEIFKGYLETISKSSATNDNDVLMKNLSECLLEYGNEIDAKSIDDYMDVLKDILDSVQISKATSPINVTTKNILL